MKYQIQVKEKGCWENVGISLDDDWFKETLNHCLNQLEKHGFNVRLLPDVPTTILAV